MEAEVEPTPKRTGQKPERSLSAGSIARSPELVIAGRGKTTVPQRWLDLASFANITTKLIFDGNARGKTNKPEKQPEVIDLKDRVWNEIMIMGNTQKYTTGESGGGSGAGVASAPRTEKV